jgi:hypothetical protein
VQVELATLLGLVPEANGSNSLCLCQFEIAIDALLAATPKLELARGLRMKFEEQMWAKRFGGCFLKALPTTRVVFGLFMTSILLVPALIWSTNMHFHDDHSETMDVDLLVLVCCFGAFGAVTSINLPEATLVYFALAAAFVAGFSERFGEDLTTIVANKMGAARPKRERVAST